jgi:ribosomal protein S18 acetylase RimI-like enzyme
MVVRRAHIADAGAIATLHVAVWQAAYRALLPAEFLQTLSVERRTLSWERAITQGAGDVWVYEEGSQLVGFVSFGSSRDPDVDCEYTGEVYALYVDPSRWGKGYGAALLHTAMDALRDRAFTAATLWVLRGNQRAIWFYERPAFRPDGGIKVDERPNGITLNEVRYRRSLVP